MSRPAIPTSIKEQVRKECYFGCVICGSPFFEYDHIEEYSIVKEHTVQNLTLLCPTHHAAKSTNKLSVEKVFEARKRPYNSNKNFTGSFGVGESREVDIFMGTNRSVAVFSGDGEHYCLWVNGNSFLIIHNENNWLTISLTATNTSGNIVLIISKGELIVSTKVKDYLYIGDRITIQDENEFTILDINLSNKLVKINTGIFLMPYGDGFVVNNSQLITFINETPVGLSTGGTSRGNGFGIWGILNSKHFPINMKPGGFGVFRTV